jgi:Tol biopolymer transport system component
MPVDSAVPQKVIETALNGSISPDDENIAFIREDGIYISNLDGSEQKRLVTLNSRYHEVTFYPFPQWSPDGRYLIYHRCQNTQCYRLKDFSMYLFDLETMIETKIADNGLFPTWIR